MRRNVLGLWMHFQCTDEISWPTLSSPPAGYPVGQSGQEVLCSQPAVSLQHRRLCPPPCKPHQRYLSGCQKRLPLPPSRLLCPAPTPAPPVYPLCPQCRLHHPVVRSGSQHDEPAASTTAASLSQRLPASGALRPSTGPSTGTGPLPAHCHSAEVSEQPRGAEHEDHVGAGRPGQFYWQTAQLDKWKAACFAAREKWDALEWRKKS